MEIKCNNCESSGWVCEDHPSKAWGDGDSCCGGAGAPCKECNPCDNQTAPRMPSDTQVIWDINRGYLQ